MAYANAVRTNQYKVNRRTAYVNGSAARQLDVVKEMQQPYKKADMALVKNRAKAKKMSPGYVLFLATAVCFTVFILVSYIRMQSQLTVSVKRTAYLESELNALKLTNDEEFERIEASVNLEEIKRIAVEELGMTYAKSGQVVTISDEGSDYVRQMKSLN